METPKTLEELFKGTGIKPEIDEEGNTHWNFKAKLRSPVFCEHANEVPMECKCDENCYCKQNTCKDR